MLRKLFDAPWPDERDFLALPIREQAAHRIYGYWRSRGWQLVLGEMILWLAVSRWHDGREDAYAALPAMIAICYILGLIPSLTIPWLVITVFMLMIHGMLINGLGAVTALSFMLPYTFAGMLLSGRKCVIVQAWCVTAFWTSLLYEVSVSDTLQVHPPRYILVSYNILLAAFTFQGLRFLNRVAVDLTTTYVAEEVRQQSHHFLARVSHELRTPLNSVLGFAKLMRRAELPEPQQNYLHQIIDEGEQLNRLVSDLLDSAHLSTGKLTLHLESCEINTICEIVAEEHRPHIKPPLTLNLELAPQLPKIQADKVRLRQMIGNLVSNAIKHTQQGEIRIKTSVRGQSILIAIADTGAGIPTDQQKLIFVPFVQLDSRSAGVGLGLDIALQLARLHGGNIQLQSEVGKGSTFTLELPVNSAES